MTLIRRAQADIRDLVIYLDIFKLLELFFTNAALAIFLIKAKAIVFDGVVCRA